MTFRNKLPTSGLLTSGLLSCAVLGAVLGSACNSREELAPWFAQEIQITCVNAPTAVVGQPFRWELMPEGGVGDLMFEATGLPPGLTIDQDGVISGTPTMDGTFDQLVITVTDEEGNERIFDTCGAITVDKPDAPMIDCTDDSDSIPDGFAGVPYTDFTITAPGGAVPYTWEATGLPPGLTLTPDGANATSATIAGTPTTTGTYPVEITVTDANGQEVTAQCGELIINDPISVDTDALLDAFPDGCVALDVTLQDLIDSGIVFGGDGSPIECELRTDRGHGAFDFDNDPNTPATQPPGLSLTGDCAVTGTVSPSLPYGVYAFITTFSQSGQNAYVPYCAAQEVQPGSAYQVLREDTGNEATFKPGVVVIDEGEMVSYGTDVPDPRVTVTDDVGACAGNTCFYSFVFAYNTLSQMSTVSASPNSKFPAQGFDGFTHALRITDAFLEIFRGRAYVANIRFEYCIADNDQDCGNNAMFSAAERAQLVRQNGGGSNYYFSLVVLPSGN